jgi:hypothetical protein
MQHVLKWNQKHIVHFTSAFYIVENSGRTRPIDTQSRIWLSDLTLGPFCPESWYFDERALIHWKPLGSHTLICIIFPDCVVVHFIWGTFSSDWSQMNSFAVWTENHESSTIPPSCWDLSSWNVERLYDAGIQLIMADQWVMRMAESIWKVSHSGWVS